MKINQKEQINQIAAHSRPKIGQQCEYNGESGIVYAIYPGMNGISVVCQKLAGTGHFVALWGAVDLSAG